MRARIFSYISNLGSRISPFVGNLPVRPQMFAICGVLFCVSYLMTVSHGATPSHPIILFVAFDGFRPDYIDRGLTPALEALAKTGVHAKYMSNVFPTITTPNFFAIATGLYPETLGVFGNQNFDENFKCLENEADLYELFHYNDDITPLWTLNELTGEDRYSATLMWPSSQVEYQNRFPVHNIQNGNMPFRERVDKTIDFIQDKQFPANLVFLYFDEPDSTGHRHGPNSPELDATLREMNSVTEYLLKKLTENNLRDKVNLIFLSDHGMVELPSSNIVNLDTFIQPQYYTKCGSTPVLQIHPAYGYEKEIYDNLTRASRETNAFTVYRQSELPDQWHMKQSKRGSDIWLIGKLSYGFSDVAHFKGEHGYEFTDELRPFFIANGPLFKSDYIAAPFKNIDIYPLIEKVLKLRSPPEQVKPNGTLTQIQHILRNGGDSTATATLLSWIVVGLTITNILNSVTDRTE